MTWQSLCPLPLTFLRPPAACTLQHRRTTLSLSPNVVPAPSGAEGGGLPRGSIWGEEWLNEGMRGSSQAMFLESTDTRRRGDLCQPRRRVPQPPPSSPGPHLLLRHWLCGRQACLLVAPPALCLSGREIESLEGGASGALGVMGSHQVRIKPVAWLWRRIPRPARLFCCQIQRLPSPIGDQSGCPVHSPLGPGSAAAPRPEAPQPRPGPYAASLPPLPRGSFASLWVAPLQWKDTGERRLCPALLVPLAGDLHPHEPRVAPQQKSLF